MPDEAMMASSNSVMTDDDGTTVPPVQPAPVVELAEAITAAAAVMTVDAPETPAIVEKQPMGDWQRSFIGGSLVFVTLLLMTQLLAVWPGVVEATEPLTDEHPKIQMPETALLFGTAHITFHSQVILILMVMLVGGLGALVGGSRRFLYYSTRGELTKRDEWSYLIRPLQGAALALVVYFTLRGGYLGQDAASPVNPYGVAALAALVGLFTRHAVSKLTDIFDTMFGEPKEDTAAPQVKDPDADTGGRDQ